MAILENTTDSSILEMVNSWIDLRSSETSLFYCYNSMRVHRGLPTHPPRFRKASVYQVHSTSSNSI